MLNKFYLSDSGTAQKRIFNFKSALFFLKNSTKRQEIEELGAILINYGNEFTILKNMQLSLECRKTDDPILYEYLIKNACDRVINIILSHHKF